jgi:hypothetical protein
MSKNCARIAIWQTVSSLIFMAFPMAILVLLLVYGEKRSLAQEFYTPYNFVAFLIFETSLAAAVSLYLATFPSNIEKCTTKLDAEF